MFEPLDASRAGDHDSPVASRRSLVRGRARTGNLARSCPQSSPAPETNDAAQGGGGNGDTEGNSRAHGDDLAGDDSRPEADRDAAPAPQSRGGVSGIVVSPNGMSS